MIEALYIDWLSPRAWLICLPLPPIPTLASPCKFLVYFQGEAFLLLKSLPLCTLLVCHPYTITSHDDLPKGVLIHRINFSNNWVSITNNKHVEKKRSKWSWLNKVVQLEPLSKGSWSVPEICLMVEHTAHAVVVVKEHFAD